MFYLIYTTFSVLMLIMLTSLYLLTIFLPSTKHISAYRHLFFHASYIILLKCSILFLFKYKYVITQMSAFKYKNNHIDWNFGEKLAFGEITRIANLDLRNSEEAKVCCFCNKLIEFEDWLESNRCNHRSHILCGTKRLKCNGGYCSVGLCRENWFSSNDNLTQVNIDSVVNSKFDMFRTMEDLEEGESDKKGKKGKNSRRKLKKIPTIEENYLDNIDWDDRYS